MRNIDQLLVRACKSKEPLIRLRTVYRRFYTRCAPENVYLESITQILARICDEHLSITVLELITNLHPNSVWYPNFEVRTTPPENLKPKRETEIFLNRALDMLISKIRQGKASEFNGLTPPAKFRRRL